jgi:TonB family protein
LTDERRLIEEGAMSKRITYLIAAVLLSAVVVNAQDTDHTPFIFLDNELVTANRGWSGDKASLSKIFDNERRRLGTRFESELLNWLGDDPEKHYWTSLFIDWESYLHGNKRLPELSLLIKQQGLTLVKTHQGDDSKGLVIGLSITAAILSDELGLAALARFYKHQAEDLLRSDPSLSRHVPELSESERRRYDGIEIGIGSRRIPVVVGDSKPAPRAPISGGIMNGRARKLAKPKYPDAARAARISGSVEVRIVFDETGKVISAKAISGPPELRQASEDAAWASEFSPVKLSGQPVKVTGIIIYNFVAR